MKTKNLILATALLLVSSVIFAQKLEVNTEKSSVHWLGKKIKGQHDGYIKIKNGFFEISNDKFVSGNFVMDMNSITNNDLKNGSFNKKLVKHLKSDDFFAVDKYPTSKFVITKSSAFNNGKATVTGDITIKGKTESISFDVMKTNNEYTATIEVDRSKFDVKYGSTSFFDDLGNKAIDDIFTLTVKLVTK